MNFRADINGLRSIAVIGVVVFHYFATMLPGGFAGVDVFFVISGYLMTSIIFKGVADGTFKIAKFYYSRYTRIVPALSVLCFVLMLFGWFYLHPSDLAVLGKHALASLTFLSNISYWKESGYFDEASREKWLLHTWSLSVEWQFYIIYPVFIVILNRFLKLKYIKYAVIIAFLCSFILCLYASRKWPSSSFFLIPTRSWEMLAGGVVFLYPCRLGNASKRLLEMLGLGLILASYFLLSEANVWPGFLTLLPVFGSVAVIVSQRERSCLTGNFVFQWIGKISYSVYLWHWPFVVWLNYTGNNTSTEFLLLFMCLSIVMGAFSYYLVERNRDFFNMKFMGKLSKKGASLAYLFVIILSASIVQSNGFDFRLSEEYLEFTKNQVMPMRENGYCFVDFNSNKDTEVSQRWLQCKLGDKTRPAKILLFGDSFAGQYEPFWDELGKSLGVSINSISTNWCMPAKENNFDGPTDSNSYRQCQLNRSYLFKYMTEYDVIVFAGMWSNSLNDGNFDEINETIQEAARKSRLVVVMPSPTLYNTNVLKRFQRSFFYKTNFNLNQYSKSMDLQAVKAYNLLKHSGVHSKNVVYLEREQVLPISGLYEKNGLQIPLSFDGMHITLEASIEAANYFLKSDYFLSVFKSKLASP